MLSAVVMVDVVQLVIMFVGGISLLFLSMWEVGGFGELQHKVLENKPKVVVSLNVEKKIGEEEVRKAIEASGLQLEGLHQIPVTKKGDNPNRFFVNLESLGSPSQKDEVIAQTRIKAKARMAEKLGALCGGKDQVELQLRSFESHFHILLPHHTDRPYPWTGIIFGLGIVLAIAYMSGNQAIVQRTLGARSEWDAKGGMLFGGFLKAFIPLMVAVPGLCAIVLAPNLADADRAVPEMIRILLPPGLKGLMFVALFAALMSSVDSTLNSASTIWTTDLYGRLYHLITGHKLDGRQGLIIGRIFTFVFILSAGYLAPYIGQRQGLYVFIQSALSMFQGPTLAILLLGIMWRRATGWGAFAGLVLGVAFTTILNNVEGLFPANDPFLFVAWWSFVFSMLVTAIVSLLTPPEPDEKIRGLVWGQIMKDGKIQRVLQERVS